MTAPRPPSTRRRDPFSGAEVLLAPGRRGVPAAPSLARFEGARTEHPRCPFCPGAEAETEPTTAALYDDAGAWRARSVRNRYPAVHDAASPDDARALRGVHEVLLESPRHDADLPGFTARERRDALWLYRDRARALEATPGARCVLLFRNRGARSGSSQPHPHAQCVALPFVPPAVRDRDARLRRSFERHGASLYLRERERVCARGARLVEGHRDDAFVALTPWAPQRPYEQWLVARDRVPFARLDDPALEALGALLARSLRRQRSLLGDAAYNLVLRQSALDALDAPWTGWHLELLPRLGGDAGLELGAGLAVTSVAPEEAARALREVAPERLDDA